MGQSTKSTAVLSARLRKCRSNMENYVQGLPSSKDWWGNHELLHGRCAALCVSITRRKAEPQNNKHIQQLQLLLCSTLHLQEPDASVMHSGERRNVSSCRERDSEVARGNRGVTERLPLCSARTQEEIKEAETSRGETMCHSCPFAEKEIADLKSQSFFL